MENFDLLLNEYKQAVEAWVSAIKAEEALANPDHSMIEMEKWDAADLAVREAEGTARQARDSYKSVLREKNYGF